jgi:hypothetical protein
MDCVLNVVADPKRIAQESWPQPQLLIAQSTGPESTS